MKGLTERLIQKRYILVISIGILLLLASCGKKGEPLPKGLPIPGGINDLAGEVKDGVLFLSFSVPTRNKDGSEVKDLAGFKILKGCGSCMGVFEPFKDIRMDEGKGYTVYDGKLFVFDDDLMNGFQYAYKVYPYTRKGISGDASNIFSIKWEKPPEAPTNVSGKENDERVELTWTKEEGFSYNVYRYSGDIYPLFPLNKNPLTTPGFVDSGLENGKRYRYEIRKVREKDGLKWEGEGFKVEATPKDKTPPATPKEVKAERKENGVSITWKENTEKDLMGYNVYRIATGKAEKLNKEPVKEHIYFDQNVPDSRYVSYYVTALDTSGNESDPSRESIVMMKGMKE